MIILSDGNILIINVLSKVTEWVRLNLRIELKVEFRSFPRKNFSDTDRTKTDTGGLVEYTKTCRIIMLKELGKMTP